MRILLYTGKGGAGKTTIAAATAVRCAETNRRTLLVGGDGSQSLADCLNSPLTDEPQEVGPNLWAQEIDPLERLERSWPRIEALLGGCVSDSISGTIMIMRALKSEIRTIVAEIPPFHHRALVRPRISSANDCASYSFVSASMIAELCTATARLPSLSSTYA